MSVLDLQTLTTADNNNEEDNALVGSTTSTICSWHPACATY
ncbi:hypothetical protein [Streptomyces sp. NPDC048442]